MTNGNCPVCGAPALLLADCHCSRLGCQNYHPRMNVVAEPKRPAVEAAFKHGDKVRWVGDSGLEHGREGTIQDELCAATGGSGIYNVRFPVPYGQDEIIPCAAEYLELVPATPAAEQPAFAVGDKVKFTCGFGYEETGVIGSIDMNMHNSQFEVRVDGCAESFFKAAKELSHADKPATRGFAVGDKINWAGGATGVIKSIDAEGNISFGSGFFKIDLRAGQYSHAAERTREFAKGDRVTFNDKLDGTPHSGRIDCIVSDEMCYITDTDGNSWIRYVSTDKDLKHDD